MVSELGLNKSMGSTLTICPCLKGKVCCPFVSRGFVSSDSWHFIAEAAGQSQPRRVTVSSRSPLSHSFWEAESGLTWSPDLSIFHKMSQLPLLFTGCMIHELTAKSFFFSPDKIHFTLQWHGTWFLGDDVKSARRLDSLVSCCLHKSSWCPVLADGVHTGYN